MPSPTSRRAPGKRSMSGAMARPCRFPQMSDATAMMLRPPRPKAMAASPQKRRCVCRRSASASRRMLVSTEPAGRRARRPGGARQPKAASAAGIQPGDVMVGVDQTPVKSARQADPVGNPCCCSSIAATRIRRSALRRRLDREAQQLATSVASLLGPQIPVARRDILENTG